MKYILYCTKNNINSKIYIGVHKTFSPYKFDGYLGNGCLNDGSGNSLKAPFQKALKKYGYENFTRTTLGVYDTEQQAYEAEAHIVDINFVKRTDTYNVAVGGYRNVPNTPVSMFNLLGEFIKSFDDMSVAAKYLRVSPTSVNTACSMNNRTCRGYYFRYGIVQSIEVPKNSVSLNREGIPIVQYSKAGYRMKTWDSAKHAAYFYHYARATITAACRGKKRTANGYQWRYLSDGLESLPSVDPKGGSRVAIFITDKEGIFLESFKSISEAQAKTGVSANTIGKALKDGKFRMGYFWFKQEVDDMI